MFVIRKYLEKWIHVAEYEYKISIHINFRKFLGKKLQKMQ